MSTEIEAKFLVADPSMARRIRGLRRLGSYTLGEPREQRVRDHYIDTSDRALLAGGWACRIRRHDDGCLVTLKSVRSPRTDVHEREELEVALSADLCSPETPPLRWPASPARDKVLEIAGVEPLQRLFTIEQDRSARAVLDGDRRVAAASLDEVRVDARDAPLRWVEMEVELSENGTETDLKAISAWIRVSLGLQPVSQSKFERALGA